MVLAAEVQELFGRLRKQHPARGGGGVLLRTMSSLWSAGELGVCSAPGVTALSEADRVRTGGGKPGGEKMATMSHIFCEFDINKVVKCSGQSTWRF